MRKTLWAIPLLLMTVTITGCGLSKAKLADVKQVQDSITTTESRVKERATQFTEMQKSGDWEFLRPYAQKENWAQSLTEAQADVARAKELNQQQVVPIVTRNKSKEVRQLDEALARIRATLNAAAAKSKVPADRATVLLTARKEAPVIAEKAKTEAKEADGIIATLRATAEEFSTRYESKRADIAKRLEPIAASYGAGNNAYQQVAFQYNAVTSSKEADYAALTDSAKVVTERLTQLKKDAPAFQKKLGELDESYTKILADMRIDNYVIVSRTSWDEDSDWPSEHEYNYPARKIEDDALFDYYDNLPEEALLATRGWGGGISVKIPQDKWDSLRIDPKENWPSSWDDMAEYSLDDALSKCYHRYTYVRNGVKDKDTDWEEVSCDTFEQDEDNLGMAILAKSMGEFEEERDTTPAPPGMAEVGNPKYGQWKTDASTGSSFWEFYGQYALMRDLLGGPVYRDDYDDWRTNYRRRTPYYGDDDDDDPRWGTASSHTQSTYGGTTYAKRGGLSAAASEARAERGNASVRGAGPATRGGGPGGGGK